MQKFKFEDFTHEAQIGILAAQDELNAADHRHIVSHIGHLKLPLRENCESFPLVKNALFTVQKDEDGTESYVFSHAELIEET